MITFQRLTSDTTSIILAEPAFLNSAQSELAISSMSNGLLLPPGSISVKQKRQYLTNYNIQISSRTIKGTFPSKAPVQIRLIDVSERSVFEKKNIEKRFYFDIQQATSGVYMLSITNHEGSIAYPVCFEIKADLIITQSSWVTTPSERYSNMNSKKFFLLIFSLTLSSFATN